MIYIEGIEKGKSQPSDSCGEGTRKLAGKRHASWADLIAGDLFGWNKFRHITMQPVIWDQHIHAGEKQQHDKESCGGTEADDRQQDMRQKRKYFRDMQIKLVAENKQDQSRYDQQGKKQGVEHSPESQCEIATCLRNLVYGV